MPEQLAREISDRHVAKQLRIQLAPRERLAVCEERYLFLGTALDVVEHRLRQFALGDLAKVIGHVRAVQQPLHRIALETAELDQLEYFMKVHAMSV